MSAASDAADRCRGNIFPVGVRGGALLFTIAGLSFLPHVAVAQSFSAISAGNMTERSVILWTQMRQGNGGQQYSAGKKYLIKAELSDDPNFKGANIAYSYTIPENGDTVKFVFDHLFAEKQYYYRFTATGGDILSGSVRSNVGRFFTNPAPTSLAPLKIGFTGDYDAKYRPYSLLNRFGFQIGAADLKYFINLGDIIYERKALGSPKLPDLAPDTTPAVVQTGLDQFYRKYLEDVSGVDTLTGKMTTSLLKQQGTKGMLEFVGVYTLLDNHELYNAMISGGAPQNSQKENYLCGDTQKPQPAGEPCLQSASNTGANATFINQTTSFKTMEKAFFNTQSTSTQIDGLPTTGLVITNQPAFTPVVASAHDPRTFGTAQNFFTRALGRHALYIQLDDRSYRDARMINTGPKIADDPQRTMLGKTQLEWFKQQLSLAEAYGFVWKIVAVSTPIDRWTDFEGNLDNKSWIAGYNFERNEIMKYIVDNRIRNVVFLTTDDHNARATRLNYQPGGVNSGSPSGWADVSNAFQLLAGPAGAVGPYEDGVFYGSFGIETSRKVAAMKNKQFAQMGAPLIGLKGLPGLYNVWREDDPSANALRDSVDFFSSTTFNYATLAWDASSNLKVEYWGVNGYAPDSYPTAVMTPRKIFAFSVAPLR